MLSPTPLSVLLFLVFLNHRQYADSTQFSLLPFSWLTVNLLTLLIRLKQQLRNIRLFSQHYSFSAQLWLLVFLFLNFLFRYVLNGVIDKSVSERSLNFSYRAISYSKGFRFG